MVRRLPPLNALRAFEATARNGSLTRAAKELSVTQGAVSRHVLQLENWLGAELCIRTRRGIEITAAGSTYAAMLGGVFHQIEEHTRRVVERPIKNLLRIKMPPTFAIRWLVPRLANFRLLNRHIDVQITTSHRAAEFDQEDIDVAILWGKEPPPSSNCRRLFGETLLPVCSPRLFQSRPAPKVPADLADCVRLCSMYRPNDWPDWLNAAGIDTMDTDVGLKFENAALAYQAAVDQLGIVMAQRAFVEDDLRSARLVAPLQLQVRTANSYYLVYPKTHRTPSLTETFEKWITQQVADMKEVA